MRLQELDKLSNTQPIQQHTNLNPKLWKDQELTLPVRYKLLSIAKDFIDFIGVLPVELRDITISGSNASYNYTSTSDIDLHLIVDVPETDDVAIELFDAKKNQYNFLHDIKIKGIDVEVYVQRAEEKHHSAGIYSVLDNKWLKEPNQETAEIDENEIQNKVNNYAAKIAMALVSNNLESATDIMSELRKLRQAGLEKEGEYSLENLAFKKLRSYGLIQQLRDHIYDLKDQKLSLEAAMKIDELLKVEKDDQTSTTLVDPETGTKTVIDKKKNPNAIQLDKAGQATLQKKTTGNTEPKQSLKPGQNVQVKDTL